MAKAGSSKYQPLADHLAAQPGDEVTLSFAEIMAILGAALPASAYVRAWWTGRSPNSVRTQGWRQVGWEVTAVTRREREWWVTFRRQR